MMRLASWSSSSGLLKSPFGGKKKKVAARKMVDLLPQDDDDDSAADDDLLLMDDENPAGLVDDSSESSGDEYEETPKVKVVVGKQLDDDDESDEGEDPANTSGTTDELTDESTSSDDDDSDQERNLLLDESLMGADDSDEQEEADGNSTIATGMSSLLTPSAHKRHVSNLLREAAAGAVKLSSMPRIKFSSDVGDLIRTLDDGDDVPLIRRAVITLRKQSWTESARTSMARNGGIPALVRAMERHSDDVVIQTNACEILLNLTAHGGAESQELIAADAFGLEAIVAAMQRHAHEAQLQQMACLALWNLMDNNDENKMQFAELTLGMTPVLCGCEQADYVQQRHSGMFELIQALENHSTDLLVARAACGALSTALHGNESNQERMYLIEGAVETLLCVMDTWHAKDVQVNRNAMAALHNLVACNARLEHQDFFLENGLQVVLRVMERHSTDSSIQASACGVLKQWARFAQFQQELVDDGAIPALVKAMVFNAESAVLQQKACVAFCNLLMQGETSSQAQARIAAPSTEDLQELVEEYSAQSGAQSSPYRELILAADAIPAILAAMDKHASEPRVQEAGCLLLVALAAEDAECQALVVQNGGSALVQLAVENNADTLGCNEAVQTLRAVLREQASDENLEELLACFGQGEETQEETVEKEEAAPEAPELSSDDEDEIDPEDENDDDDLL